MLGFKGFDADMICRGFKYEVGKSYETDEDIVLCKKGFHFCEKLIDCLSYYPLSKHSRYAVIEAYGEIKKGYIAAKCVTNKIRILMEIPIDDVMNMVNIGSKNAGHGNTGNWNTGSWNTGSWNTGRNNGLLNIMIV